MFFLIRLNSSFAFLVDNHLLRKWESVGNADAQAFSGIQSHLFKRDGQEIHIHIQVQIIQ